MPGPCPEGCDHYREVQVSTLRGAEELTTRKICKYNIQVTSSKFDMTTKNNRKTMGAAEYVSNGSFNILQSCLLESGIQQKEVAILLQLRGWYFPFPNHHEEQDAKFQSGSVFSTASR